MKVSCTVCRGDFQVKPNSYQRSRARFEQKHGEPYSYICHGCSTGSIPIMDETLSGVCGYRIVQSDLRSCDVVRVPCSSRSGPGCSEFSEIQLDSLRRSIRAAVKARRSFTHSCHYCTTGGYPSVLRDPRIPPFIDSEKTVSDFGEPATLESRIWLACCSCDESRAVFVSSLQTVFLRHQNDPDWHPECTECANSDEYTASDSDLSVYTDGLPTHSNLKRCYIQCESCLSVIDTSTRALKNLVRAARLEGEEHSVVCHICSSSGESYVSLRECEEVGIYSRGLTVSRFGKVPQYRKDLLVAICPECKGDQEIKYDSLLRQAWLSRRENRGSLYICQPCSMKCDEVREKLAASRARQQVNGFRSSLEIATEDILITLGVNFVPQYKLGFFLFDFFLPDCRVLLECQGNYWHSLPKGQQNDASKAGYIANNFPDHHIVYLAETEFFNPELVRRKLALTAGIDDDPLQIDFKFSDLEFKPVLPIKGVRSWKSIPMDFLDSFHYARHGRAGKAFYGAYLGQVLVGLSKFTHPVRGEVVSSMGMAPGSVMELDRFCVHPNYRKKNLASWLLARSTRRLFDDFPSVLRIVSFADPEFGHSGTIYRSANWTLLGETAPSYFYLGADGSAVHKKTVYERARSSGIQERAYAELHGYILRPTAPKLKFVFDR